VEKFEKRGTILKCFTYGEMLKTIQGGLEKMDGELINPQNFIFFPYDWLFVLVIILGSLGISGFKAVISVGKKANFYNFCLRMVFYSRRFARFIFRSAAI